MHVKPNSEARKGEGGDLPCPFLIIKKSALIFEKKTLIEFIFSCAHATRNVTNILQKAPSSMFDRVLNKPLSR